VIWSAWTFEREDGDRVFGEIVVAVVARPMIVMLRRCRVRTERESAATL